MDPEAEGFTCGQTVQYAASLSDLGILDTDCPLVTAWMGECCPKYHAGTINGETVEVEDEAELGAIIIVAKDEEEEEEEEEDFLPEEATGEPAEPEPETTAAPETTEAASVSEPAVGVLARPESCGEEVYSCLVSAEPGQDCAVAIHAECQDTASDCLDDASSIVGSRDLVCGAAECLILGNPEPACRCEFVINECVNSHLGNVLVGGDATSEPGAALVGDGSGVSDRVCIESACCAESEWVSDKARCFGSEYAGKFEGYDDGDEEMAGGTTATGESSSGSGSTGEGSSGSGSTSESSGPTGEGVSGSSGGGFVDESGEVPANQTAAAGGGGYGTEPAGAGPAVDESAGEPAAADGVADEETNRDGSAGSGVPPPSGAPRHGAAVLAAAAVALAVGSLA